jgi:TolB-like protein
MRRSLALAAAGAVLLLGVQESLAETRAKLAILPIVVHTLEQKDYLRAGLADMLASRLGRVPRVAVIRVQGEGEATNDIEAARESARAAGADYVLFGSFTQFGEGASLDLRCVSVSAEGWEEPRSIFIQSGTLGEIIPRLDQVAEKVGRHLAIDGAAAGSDLGDLPAVSAGMPSDDAAGSADMLQDALSELEALRGRVDALEQRIFSPPAESVPEVDLRSGRDVMESDPELHSDLR